MPYHSKYRGSKGYYRKRRPYYRSHAKKFGRKWGPGRDMTFKASGAAAGAWNKKGDYYCASVSTAKTTTLTGTQSSVFVASLNDNPNFADMANQFQRFRVKNYSITILAASVSSNAQYVVMAPFRDYSVVGTNLSAGQVQSMSGWKGKIVTASTPLTVTCTKPVLVLPAYDTSNATTSRALGHFWCPTGSADAEYVGVVVICPFGAGANLTYVERYEVEFAGRLFGQTEDVSEQAKYSWIDNGTKLQEVLKQFPGKTTGLSLRAAAEVSTGAAWSVDDWNSVVTGANDGSTPVPGNQVNASNTITPKLPAEFTPNESVIPKPSEDEQFVDECCKCSADVCEC